MAYEQKEGTGSLFKNERKTTDNHPNATGSALIGGVAYWVSAWTKEDKNGNKYQSLSFKRKDAVPDDKPRKDRGLPEDMTSDVPF